MKTKEFKELLGSMDKARKIHAGRLKAARVTKFNPIMVRSIRLKLHASQATFAQMIGVSIDTFQNLEPSPRQTH